MKATRFAGAVAAVLAFSAAATPVMAQSFFNFVGSVDLLNDPADPTGNTLRLDFTPSGGGTGAITSVSTTDGVFTPIGLGTAGSIMDFSITPAGVIGLPINPFVTIGGYTFSLVSTDAPAAAGAGGFNFGPISVLCANAACTKSTASLSVNGAYTSATGSGLYTGTFTAQFSSKSPTQIANEVNTTGLQAVGFSAEFTTVSAVPEPATFALMGTGLVGLVGFARRRRQA